MAKKILDDNGLSYLWLKLKEILTTKVDKVDDKGLSTNDFTTEEKTKLASLKNTELVDNLTTEDASKALTANQGKVLNDKIKSITADLGNLGAGDMMKAAYDADGDGVVDDAEKLGGQLPSYYAKQADVDNKVDKVIGKSLVSDTEITKLATIEEGANKTIVDIEMNEASANPVQNKVITKNYNDLNGGIVQAMSAINQLENNKANSADVYTKLEIDDQITDLETSKANVNDVYTKTEVDAKITDLVNSAPETLDTLGEVAKAIQDNETVVEALNASIGNKVDKTDLVAITNSEIDVILAS